MKKITKFLVIILAFFALLSFAACKKEKVDYDAILASYLLENDGQTITADFTLPKTLDYKEVSYNITWTSSDSSLTLTARDVDYLASVVYPDKTKEVTLTLDLNGHTKSFTVMVAPLDVYSFSKNYTFAKDKATVTENIKLDTEYEYKGKKCQIVWAVEEAYTDYLEISADGKECIVYPSSLNPAVKLSATFKYNGEETTKHYRMTVSLPKTHAEEVDTWYNVMGTSLETTGYVVAIANAYDESFGNVSLYVMDDDMSTGYYLYRVKCDNATGVALAPGVHVSVSGALSTNYKGLIESSATGTIALDNSKENIDMSKVVFPFDNEVLGNVPGAKYHESINVSLTNWEVVEVNAVHASSSPTTVLKIKKGEATVAINYTKYLQGIYSYSETDATVQAILAKVATINVGDYVSVNGLLGYYEGFQISLFSADGIQAGSQDPDTTEYPGIKVGALIAANAEIINEKLTGILVANKTVELTSELDGATVSFKLGSSSQAVTVDGSTFTIVPTAKEEKVNVIATYVCGDYTTQVFFTLHTLKMSDADMAKAEAEAAVIEDVPAGETEITLVPQTFEGVTFELRLDDAETAKLVTLDGNKVTCLPVDELTEVKLTVIATCGTETATSEVTFHIIPTSFTKYEIVSTPEIGKAYKLGYVQPATKQLLFQDGTDTGKGYGGVTEDVTLAVDYMIEEVEGGWAIYYLDETQTKKYYNVTVNGDYNYITIDAENKSVYSWNAEHSTLTFTLNGHTTATKDGEYYCGTYSTYTTISCSAASYLSSCDKEGATSACLKFYDVVIDNTDTLGRAQKEADNYSFDMLKKGDEIELTLEPKTYNDVTLTAALKAEYSFVTMADNKITVTADGESVQEFVVVITAKCGLATVVKELTVQVDAQTIYGLSCDEVYDVADAAFVEGQKVSMPGYYVFSGVVAKFDKYNNIYVSLHGTQEKVIECYKLVNADVKLGDYVTVKGKLVNFKGTIELDNGCTLEEHFPKKSVAEIYAIGTALENKAVTEEKYFTSGIIYKIDSNADGVATLWITDGVNQVQVYKATVGKGVENIAVGSLASVTGQVQKYNTTIEISTTTQLVDCMPNGSATVSSLGEIKLEDITKAGEVELVTSKEVNGVTVHYEYEVLEGEATISNGKLVVAALPAADATLKIKVTATLGNTVEAISTAFVADFVKFAANATEAQYIDTANIDSSSITSFVGDATMSAKWAKLLNALYVVNGSPEGLDPATADFTQGSVKGFYLANINGFLTGTKHTDTYLSKESADFSDAANVSAVLAQLNGNNFDYEKTVKVTVKAGEKLPQYDLTAKSLLGYEGTNVAYADATGVDHVIDGVTFRTTDVGAYGYGLQFKKNTGALLNTTEMKPITSIDVVFNAEKSIYDNTDAFKFEFADVEDFSSLETLYLSTVKDQKEGYTVTPSKAYKYVRISNTLGYAFYIDSFTMHYETEEKATIYDLTANALLGYTGTNVAYADATGVDHEVNSVTFRTTDVGAYGYGLQLKKNTGSLWNTSEMKGVTSIEVTFNAEKSIYDNTDAFKFEFADTADFASAETLYLSTVKDQKEGYTITPSKAYKYVRISNTLGYAFYVDSFKMTCEAKKEVNPIELTAASVLEYSDTNVAYADATGVDHVVDGVTFQTTDVGAYGYGLQFKKNTGCIYNTTALSYDGASVSFEFNTEKSVYDNTDAFKIEFANSADFTGAETLYLSTVKDQKTGYTVTATASFKYVRISNVLGYAFYIDTITINK